MAKPNKNPSHRGYIVVLFGLFVAISLFSLITIIFHFEERLVYQELIFGDICLTNVLLLFLVIAEAISLKFDKTALRITLYATICLYISYLFSSDAMYFWSYIGVTIAGFIEQLFMMLSNLAFAFFAICIFYFFQISFGGKKDHILHMAVALPLWILYSVFTLLDLPIASLVTLTIEVMYFLVFTAIYYLLIKEKEQGLSGYISILLVIFICFAMVLNQLGALGVPSLIYFCIFLGYLFIYVFFLIDKTKQTYRYEEIETLRSKDDSLTITCFHCFDCFYRGEHLSFPSKKSKEYFALLVIFHGKTLTSDKAIAYLYPDKDIEKAKRSFRKIVSETKDYLSSLGLEAVTLKRGESSLDIHQITCDFYDVLDGKRKYKGESLIPEYNWSFEFESELN